VLGLTPAAATGIHEAPSGSSQESMESLLSFNPEVELGRLANGMTYYIRENAEPKDRAYLRLVVNAGSVLETDEQQGLAHFLEQMAFNGTEDYPGNQLVRFLESLGMEFGADVNAYTSFDETVYKLTIPTNEEGKLETGFHVLEQWANAIELTPEEIEKERGVVLEEWRFGRGAQQRMRDEQFPVLFQGSKYAERLPIGKREIIRTFDRETLLQFYRDWYRPELMAVIAVGDFDKNRVREMIKSRFSSLEREPDAPFRELYSVPSHEETLYAPASDPEARYTTVSIYNKRDAKPLNTLGDYREMLVHSLFTSMLNTRFSELTSNPEVPIRRARAGRTDLVRTEGVNYLTAVVEDREVETGLRTLVTEARRVKQYGFTDSEFERAKANVRTAYKQSYAERDKTDSESFVREYIRHYLSGEASPGIAREYEIVQEYLPGITLEEVNEVAGEYLKSENRVVLVNAVEKEDDPIPGKEALAAALEEAEKAVVEPYKDTTPDQPLVQQMPQPGEIVEERERDEVGVTEWTLSNGVEVALKPTDFKNDEILFTAYGPGGSSLAAEENHMSASMAASIVQESGVADFSKTDLGKVLSGKTVSVSPYISELRAGLSGSSSKADLETMFKLIRLYMTQPRKSEDAFKAWRQRMSTMVQNRREQPVQFFVDKIREILSQDHPRRQPLTVERLQEVDLDEAMRFYTERFTDASDFRFVFVGNIDEQQLRELSRRYLASLPADPDEEQFRDVGVQRPEGVVKESVRSGIAPKSYVGIVYHGSYDWSPERNYEIRSVAQYLQMRLREVIREEQSGTYALGVWTELERHPKERYTVNIYFGTDPDRAEELSAKAQEIVDELRNQAPDQSYVERVRSGQLSNYQKSLEQNDFWRQNLRELYWYDLPLDTVLEYPDRAEELDAELLRETAARYLSEDRYVRVILYPEQDESEDGEGSEGGG
jgi:zinc protease